MVLKALGTSPVREAGRQFLGFWNRGGRKMKKKKQGLSRKGANFRTPIVTIAMSFDIVLFPTLKRSSEQEADQFFCKYKV